MRTIRRFTQLVLTMIGGAIVIVAVYQIDSIYQRALVAALGLLVMELGVWQVTRAFFPNEREYKPLRDETDYFLGLVRRLNRSALLARDGNPSADREMEELQADMHHSVDRMRRLAGFTQEELGLSGAPERPPERSRKESKIA
jgi:hypothetical protein